MLWKPKSRPANLDLLPNQSQKKQQRAKHRKVLRPDLQSQRFARHHHNLRVLATLAMLSRFFQMQQQLTECQPAQCVSPTWVSATPSQTANVVALVFLPFHSQPRPKLALPLSHQPSLIPTTFAYPHPPQPTTQRPRPHSTIPPPQQPTHQQQVS